MEVVSDCDIVSTLAKIDGISILVEIFEDRRIVIPNAVYVELLETERMGFTFTCEQNDVKVLDLKDILRIAARKKVINEIEMIKLIKDIEVKDNTIIVEKDEILQEYEN